MRSWFRMGLWIGSGMCLAACAEELSIGADACPRGAKCEVERLSVPRVPLDVHTTGAALEPGWKAPELQLEDSQVRQVAWHSVIASGPTGGLWLFTDGEEALEVTLLDSEGNVVGARSVPSPSVPDIKESRAFGRVRAAASHSSGPVVNVEWGLACHSYGAGSEQELNCSRPLSEVLVFGTSADEPPTRILPFGPDNLGQGIDTIHRSADGDAVLVTSAGQSGLQKFDLEGTLMWQRELTLEHFDELPHTQTRQSGVTPFRNGAVGPDGHLILGIELWIKGEEHEWRVFPNGLLSFDEAGATSVRLYDQASDLAPPGEGPPNQSNGAAAFDSQGRLLVTYRTLDGDLLILRIAEHEIETVRLLREDYADLALGDIAVDPAGIMYLATAGGGRDETTPLLCRIPESGSRDCFTVPDYLHDIEAPAPGSVFAVTQQGLVRFSLP